MGPQPIHRSSQEQHPSHCTSWRQNSIAKLWEVQDTERASCQRPTWATHHWTDSSDEWILDSLAPGSRAHSDDKTKSQHEAPRRSLRERKKPNRFSPCWMSMHHYCESSPISGVDELCSIHSRQRHLGMSVSRVDDDICRSKVLDLLAW